MNKKKAKKLVITCGVLALMLSSLTGCKKEQTIETSAPVTAIETTAPSIELNDPIDKEIDKYVVKDYTPEEQESIEAEMESIEHKTNIDVDTGELIVVPDYEDIPDEFKETISPSDTKRKMIDSIIGMYQEGSLSSIDEAIEELDFFLGIENNTSPEEREAYIEEIKAAKPPVDKQEVVESKPVETAPVVQESKPVETKPVETTSPVVQESQGNTEVPAGLEDFFLSQEEIDKAGELHGEGGSANLTDEDWASVH